MALSWRIERSGKCRSGLAWLTLVGLCVARAACIADSGASGWLTDCASAAAAVLLAIPIHTHYADYAHDAPVGW